MLFCVASSVYKSSNAAAASPVDVVFLTHTDAVRPSQIVLATHTVGEALGALDRQLARVVIWGWTHR